MTKRILALVLSLITLLSAGLDSGFVTAFAETAEEELIVNGGFETVTDTFPDNWENTGGTIGTNYILDTTTVHGGSNSVKVVTDASVSQPAISQEIEVVSGATYKLSAWASAEAGSVGVYYKVEFYDSNKQWISQDSGSNMIWMGESYEVGNWLTGTKNFTTPANCVYAKVYLRIQGGQTVYLDDVSVIGPKPGEASDECAHSGGTATCNAKAICDTCEQEYGEFDATNHGANETEIRDAVAASENAEGYTGDTYCKGCNAKIASGKVIPMFEDLIVNGGFETVTDTFPDNWENTGGTKGTNYILDTTTVHGGSNSVKVVTDASVSQPAINQEIEVASGATYKLSAWASAEAGSVGVYYKVEFYDSNKQWISQDSGSNMIWMGESYEVGNWLTGTKNFTTPANCVYAKVFLRIQGGQTVYLDDVSVIGPKREAAEEGSCAHTGGTATCIDKAVCTVCGEPYGELNSSKHVGDTEVRDAKEATETEKGYTGDTYCLSCEAKISSGKEIPMIGDTKIQLLKNPGLEDFDGNTLKEWAVNGGPKATAETTIVHGGNTSLKLEDSGDNYSWLQQTHLVVAETPYTASAYVYPVDMGTEGKFAIKIEYYGRDEYGINEFIGKEEPDFTDWTLNEWNQITLDFTPPEGTVHINILFRMNKGKVAYFDDLSLVGEEAEAEPAKPSVDYVPMPENSKELLTNNSFEELTGVGPTGWEAIGGAWEGNQFISITNEEPHEGNNAVRINSTTNNNPWIRYETYGDFKKGEVYQLSAYVRKETSGNYGFKLEFFDEEKTYLGGTNSDYMMDITGGEWIHVVRKMTIPYDCSNVSWYFRMFSTGVTDVDSVSFYRIEEATKMTVETDEIFYYTEEAEKGGYGTADAFLAIDSYPELADATVTFRIKDEAGNVLEGSESTGHQISDQHAYYDFRMSLLKEEWKNYIMEAVAVDADGKELAKATSNIYKYPRPTLLNEEGRIVLDGEIFNPVMYYHVMPEQYGLVKALGATVVQSNSETLSGIQACLDEAEKHGLKVMAALYRNMRPAGEESNVYNTTEIITKLKDHPALLGYMVMDEPSSNWAQKLYVFEDSYKLIRTLDPDHPVYMLDCMPSYFKTFSKYADIFVTDPYLENKDYQVKRVRDWIEIAVEATETQKPVWSIMQLHRRGTYMPDEKVIRNMLYQSFMGGATGVGHYAFYDAYYDENGSRVSLDKTPVYDYVKNVYMDSETNAWTNEITEAFKHFVDRAYPIFAERDNGTYWHSAYVKEGAVYMVTTNNTDQDVACNIPLTSDGGAVTIGAFTAEVLYGGTAEANGNDILSFTLPADTAYVWKITPSETVDFSALNTTKYRDTYQTPWAAEEIRELEAAEIINDWTATGVAATTKITRAEFAYMYVNALGLTAEAADNFADVESDAYYAEALAIGKALGILKGDSNDNYYPEEELSRQDMMTIIARGMELSDAEADQLVVSGKGNTTRAEAAVIIKRLMDNN